MNWLRVHILVALACIIANGVPLSAAQPGEVITAANVDSVAEQVSPGMRWCIQHGMNLTIGPYKRVILPKAYTAATEQYAGQVRLGDNATRLDGYVAGMPFPSLDPNDPELATKIMWNYYYRPYFTDDYAWQNFAADTGPINPNAGMSIERSYAVRHFGRLFYNGRLYVDPKPVLPNQEGFRYKEIIGPILEPFDLKGVNTLNYHYMDPHQPDDTWLYFPTLRRVRRLSTAQRSDAILGQDFDIDSNDGYSGSPMWMTWRFLGEK